MSAPEAGWYPDETDDRLARYWDGSSWSGDTRRRDEILAIPPDDAGAEVVGHPPGGAGPASAPAPSRPARRGPAWATHPLTLISAFFVVAALVAGLLVVLTGDEAAATPVALEPAGTDGTDPFMDSIATDAVDPDGIEPGGVTQITTNPDQPAPTITGDTPGLYGGTGNDTVCDPTALVEFLDNHPDKAQAFATVQGIAPDAIADFVATLTPVLLREDTRVTNHGFTNGQATPLQSVLQAGTAVLVDQRGTPRVRCACGNPLTEPAATPTNPTFTGTTWNGFDDTRLITVTPSPQPLDTLTITDITTGQTQDIPTGTSTGSGGGGGGGNGGVVLAADGLGVVDFGASPDDTIAALTDALGQPDTVRDIPGEAGALPSGEGCLAGLEQADGVTYAEWGRLRVAAGPTVGFYVWRFVPSADSPISSPTSDGLETPEGLGTGATSADFEAAYAPVTAEPFPVFEGEDTGAQLLTSPTGYEASDDGRTLFELAASSQPSNEVCVGLDGFRL